MASWIGIRLRPIICDCVSGSTGRASDPIALPITGDAAGCGGHFGLDAIQRSVEVKRYAALLGLVWFGIALLLLAGYAVVQVSRWSAQDQAGRVEMLLSARSRAPGWSHSGI